jgi:hypothetical protein
LTKASQNIFLGFPACRQNRIKRSRLKIPFLKGSVDHFYLWIRLAIDFG